MPEAGDEPDGRPRRRPWLRLAPLLVLVAASVAVIASGVLDRLTLDGLVASRAALKGAVAADPLRAMALAGAAYVGAVVISVPLSPFMTMFCGFLFGWAGGAVVGVLSATVGATIVFSVGRAAAGDLLRRHAGVRLQRLAAGFMRDAFSYILFLRLLPIFPFWLTNLAPAAFGVRLPVFALATFLGLIPGGLTYAITGAGIDSVVAAHEAARAACLAAGEGVDCERALTWRSLVTTQMLAALACLGILALTPVAIRRMRGRRRAALDGTGRGG